MEKGKDAKETTKITYPPYILYIFYAAQAGDFESHWQVKLPCPCLLCDMTEISGGPRGRLRQQDEGNSLELLVSLRSEPHISLVLIGEASSSRSLFCKTGTLSCGVNFCRGEHDVRKLVNVSGMGEPGCFNC